MRQILQSLKTGTTEVAEVPCPTIQHGQILIRSIYSLVSAGTERMLVEFGKASWIEKACQQPDKVRLVLDKIKTDGLIPTIEAISNKLDRPLPLGYCNVGTVLEVGSDITAFTSGERVISNGKHAEVVSVPINLCAKVPNTVSDEDAAFTVLGATALQGIRLIQPTLGEAIVVTGLGLIGLMAVQLLRAHGCRVLGLDLDPAKLVLARQFGAETVELATGQNPLAAAQAFSRRRGVDAVLITASTRSSQPVHQAAQMCRKRGRIVLVGVTGLELARTDFYEKELTFQVSCSYGPGRHDPGYEEKAHDYPVGFVRWTEQRNFEAVLDMMAEGRLNVKPLISHRFPIAEAERAYALIGSVEPSLGILLRYPTAAEQPVVALRRQTVAPSRPSPGPCPLLPSRGRGGKVTIGFIGAGNYATAILIPAFRAAGAWLQTVACNGGVSGLHAGRKFGFATVTTDAASILADDDVQAVVIATRHDSHAGLVLKALAAGKHVFVEKPLCLTLRALAQIEAALTPSPLDPLLQGGSATQTPLPPTLLPATEGSNLPSHLAPRTSPFLMVGFNRRFAPQAQKIKALLATVGEPKNFIMTVNAGVIPSEHWTQNREVGGGRIVGEACHFVDLLRFLAGAPITSWQRLAMDSPTGDTMSIGLAFADGSTGTVHYLANGNKAFPKERLEVFAAGRVLQLDNFRRLTGYGWPRFKKMNLWRQNKGQNACVAAFIQAIERGEPPPIPFGEILEVSRTMIELAGFATDPSPC